MTVARCLENHAGLGRALVVAVGMLLAFVTDAAAKPSSCQKVPNGVVLRVDHSDGTLKIYRNSQSDPAEDGGKVFVPIGKPVTLEVCGTNTALFTYGTKKEDIELKTLEEIQAFTGALGPYLLAAGQALAPTRPSLSVGDTTGTGPQQDDPKICPVLENRYRALANEVGNVETSRQPVAQALLNINSSIDELATVELAVRAFAEKLDPEIDQLQEPLRQKIAAAVPNDRLSAYSDLLTAYTTLEKIPGLEQASARLRDEVRDISEKAAASCPQLSVQIGDGLAEVGIYLDGVDAVAALAREAWADRNANFDAALALESFARNLLNAKPVWSDPEPFKVEWDKGKTVTITITRREDPVLARVNATQKPLEVTVQVLPDRVFRPSVGLALLYTKDAVFPTYGTKAVPGVETGEVSIVEKDQADERFSYGLTLGMTWRFLDWRQSSGWAVWLPELTINPAEDKRGFEVGVGVSYKMFKLGAGVGWTKHSVLDGQNVDDVLPDDGSLKTEDVYGKPKVYLSFSVIGWPPFKK
jgi:hypothetical protein